MKGANRFMKIILTISVKKILIWWKWAILGPKIILHHNSGSTQYFFFKFCTIKGANRFMEIISMVFPKKICFVAVGSFFCPKITYHISGSTLRICFTMKGAKRYIKIILPFLEKFFCGANASFWTPK